MSVDELDTARIGSNVRVTWPAFGEHASLCCLSCVLKARSETTITIIEVTPYSDGTRALWSEHTIPRADIRAFAVAHFAEGE